MPKMGVNPYRDRAKSFYQRYVLIEALRNENSKVRSHAAEALAHLGVWARTGRPAISLSWIANPAAMLALTEALRDEGAVPALIATLWDVDLRVRYRAATALGAIGDPTAVRALIEAVRDESRGIQGSAIVALGYIGGTDIGEPAKAPVPAMKAAVPVLIEAFNDGDRSIRKRAIIALGRIGEPAKSAVPVLLEVLRDEDDTFHQTVLMTLGEIGDPRAVGALIEALQQGDSSIRNRAGIALGKMGAPAVPALIEVLKDNSVTNGKNENTRLEYLKKINPRRLRKNPNAERSPRFYAVRALGEIGEPAKDAVPAVIEALKDEESWVRLWAAVTLYRIDKSNLNMALSVLMKALRDNDRYIRNRAGNALWEIGKPAVPAVIEALRSANSEVRSHAAKALEHMGEAAKDAVPALIEALSDENEMVRMRAVLALKKIGTPEAMVAVEKEK